MRVFLLGQKLFLAFDLKAFVAQNEIKVGKCG